MVTEERLTCWYCGYINKVSSVELKKGKTPVCGNCNNILTQQGSQEPRIFAPIVEAQYHDTAKTSYGSKILKKWIELWNTKKEVFLWKD